MVLLFLLTLDSRKERPWNQNACARKGRGLLGWALTSVDVTLILWKEICILFGMEGMQLKMIEIDAVSPRFSFPLIVSLVWWDYPFSITSFSSQSLIFKWYVSVICEVPKCRKGNVYLLDQCDYFSWAWFLSHTLYGHCLCSLGAHSLGAHWTCKWLTIIQWHWCYHKAEKERYGPRPMQKPTTEQGNSPQNRGPFTKHGNLSQSSWTLHRTWELSTEEGILHWVGEPYTEDRPPHSRGNLHR